MVLSMSMMTKIVGGHIYFEILKSRSQLGDRRVLEGFEGKVGRRPTT